LESRKHRRKAGRTAAYINEPASFHTKIDGSPWLLENFSSFYSRICLVAAVSQVFTFVSDSQLIWGRDRKIQIAGECQNRYGISPCCRSHQCSWADAIWSENVNMPFNSSEEVKSTRGSGFGDLPLCKIFGRQSSVSRCSDCRSNH
jgi:hypothetical protein